MGNIRPRAHITTKVLLISTVGLLVAIWVLLKPKLTLRLHEFRARVSQLQQLVEKTKTTLFSPQPLDQNDILAKVNELRSVNNLPPLITGDLCDQIDLFPLLEEDAADTICPTCTSFGFIVAQNVLLPETMYQSWQPDSSASAVLNHPEATKACVAIQDRNVAILVYEPSSNSQEEVSLSDETSPPAIIHNFTEDELWQALVDYRHAHQKPDLLRSESLCSYARKRVEEHITLFATTAKEVYPRQDKYPLDAHAGFTRDGESGYLFETTGFRVVAENLAYWPTATYPHQIIEWGWDTSTEGHREAQLSTDYTHACLTGHDGFYVALFARN